MSCEHSINPEDHKWGAESAVIIVPNEDGKPTAKSVFVCEVCEICVEKEEYNQWKENHDKDIDN